MNIQAIRLFLHVMQRGSLAAGARELHMSPSAASRLLSGLERTTGLKLFSRDGHSLRPTVEGAQYFNECYRVLIAVDELPRTARRLASGAQSRLKLVSGARLANSLMIPAIGRFVKSHPEVEIDFHLIQAHEIDRVMSERAFDIAVGTLMPLAVPAIETSPLFDLPTVAVMRRDHVLAKRNFVRAADVAAHRLIATPMGAMREDLESLFHSEGVELHPQYTANCVHHGCRLLLQIDAIMIIDPLVALAIDPESFALVPLRPLRVVQSSIVTPALKPESRLIADFKTCLREEAKAIEKRVALLLRNAGAASKASARPAGRRPKAKKPRQG